MKIYYFLSNLSRSDYDFSIEKFSLVENVSDIDAVIDKYTHKIWVDESGRSQRAGFLEALCFMKYFITHMWGAITDIQWVYKKNFVISNSDVYEDTSTGWVKVDDHSIFVTTRDGFKHPFFYLLWSWKINTTISVVKPNFENIWGFLDKIHFIWKLWDQRGKYVGNIVIPLVMDARDDSIKKILSFVADKIGSQAIIKNNFWVEGQQVKALDLKDLDKINVTEMANNFFGWKIYNHRSPYFTPYYNIQQEYRVYFTYSKDVVKIFSIKNKYNHLKANQDIFSSDNFSKSNIDIVWEYCKKDSLEQDNNKEIKKACYSIIPKLGLQMWVLELCRTLDNQVRFIEVNPMWGTLMFPWEDEDNIKNYYEDMWSNIL